MQIPGILLDFRVWMKDVKSSLFDSLPEDVKKKIVWTASVTGAGLFGIYIVYKLRCRCNSKRIRNDPKQNFPDLSRHNNLLAECLTKEVYERYFNVKTTNGVTIEQCIQTGVDNIGNSMNTTVGVVACDEESYEVFDELFYPIIKIKLNGYDPYRQYHITDLDYTKLGDCVLDSNYVISTRIRTSRSVRGFRLPPACNRAERREVERILSDALRKFDGLLIGNYYSLNSLSESEEKQLIRDNFFFDKPSSLLVQSAGMARDWPDSRGVFHNTDKNFLIWVNEEDHIRLISMQNDSNLGEVFARLCAALKQIESAMRLEGREFMHSKKLGFVVTCPSNLGTGLKIGVHVRLPNLSSDPRFERILRVLRLQRKGAATDDKEVVDISNIDRIGKSEVELVQLVARGVSKLIEMEKNLATKEPITGLLPTGI